MIRILSVNAAGQPGNGVSLRPAFSADGARVVFWSAASDLVAGDGNGVADIFVADLATGAIARVSTTAAGEEAQGSSFHATFSPDGTRVVFASMAGNLVAGDTNGRVDVFLKDLGTGAVTRVSEDAAGVGLAWGAVEPVFSPDGGRVAFTAGLTLPQASGFPFVDQVFVKDLATGALTLVSADAAGAPGDRRSDVAAFSPDGGRVAFASAARNLVPGDTNDSFDVFVKDLATGAVTRVSTDAAGGQANGLSTGPVFSPDGSRLAFASRATNLVPGDTNGQEDIFLKDLVTGAITRISTDAAGGQADGVSGNGYRLAFSPDGTRVAFASAASNLVPGDANGRFDVFVKNIETGAITRLPADGAGDTTLLAFSPDGSQVLLNSAAPNLVAGDANGAYDVFLLDLTSVSVAGPASVAEGQSGGTVLRFTVTRSGDLSVAQGVAWHVAGAGADPVEADDFMGGALPSGLLAFAPGEAVAEVTVTVQGDTVVEGTEGLALLLVEPTGGLRLGTDRAEAVVRNDDIATRRADTLTGGEGNDLLEGLGGADLLRGLGGDDRLVGGPGPDRMEGGAGDDTYLVDHPGDRAVEALGGGADTIVASISFTLPGQVEVLVLTGRAFSGTGNGLANRIEGNAQANLLAGAGGRDTLLGGLGPDTLAGGGGADVLRGGAGADVFLFDTAPRRTEVDWLPEFRPGEDVLHLAASVFAGLALGALPESAFRTGRRARDADDRILHDRASGDLAFDADGTGPAAPVPFARVQPGLVLGASDFAVVA